MGRPPGLACSRLSTDNAAGVWTRATAGPGPPDGGVAAPGVTAPAPPGGTRAGTAKAGAHVPAGNEGKPRAWRRVAAGGS
jgi:hypothetical protein